MSDAQLALDDPRLKTADKNAAILELWIHDIQRTPTESADRWLVISLLKSALRAYNHLRSAWLSDSTYAAWACRNLLELRIFAKYVVRSAADRRRFMDDLTVDSSDSASALRKLVGREVPPSVEVDKDNHSLSRAVEALKIKSGFHGEAYLSPTKLAKEMGIWEEMSAIHKICSKLIHPTAQSILSIELELQSERNGLLLIGCSSLSEFLSEIIPFAETLVTLPPEVREADPPLREGRQLNEAVFIAGE